MLLSLFFITICQWILNLSSCSVCNSEMTSFCGFQTLERTLNALLSTPEPLRRHDPSIVVTPETRVRAQTQTRSLCVCRTEYCPSWNFRVWTQTWNRLSHWLIIIVLGKGNAEAEICWFDQFDNLNNILTFLWGWSEPIIPSHRRQALSLSENSEKDS